MVRIIKPALRAALLAALVIPGVPQALQVLDRIAAVVNDNVIMESELDQRVDDLARQFMAEGQQLPPRNVLRPQVLERMVMEKLQLDMAERGGIRVDDSSLNQTLTGVARQNGMTLDEFVAALREDGYNWADFREQIRSEMVINQLHQRQVGRRVRITDREVDRFLESEMGRQLFESEFRLGHILIGLPDGASPDQVDAARERAEALVARIRAGDSFHEMAVSYSDGPQALEGGDLGWREAAQLPSLFSERAIDMDPGEISDPIRAGNGYHILLLVDRRGGATQIVQQHRVRHVLVRTSAVRSESQAERLIVQLHQRIEGGEDFATVAREHSDDPGSARNGGDLGWVSPGEMVGEFENTFRNTPVGELSPIFQTEFGWHFLRVDELRTADMSAEFRRLRARQALHQRRFEEELQQWLRETRTEAYVDVRI
ncbi:peptidylprolyl isomerase [Alcanivorax sp. JB21]|uniref:peptidylprolyl isomerase n=1 Tax=Alcanivorax limicola TaxID=2874102 RepID=UPI001CBB053F|nr:peptidylprolyl isomerase [Alcanivorax limicola]MBZ2190078.1 peptidylprolyl isomerase [Alcanivorax limicola]